MECQLGSHDQNALATFEGLEDAGRKDLGKRWQHVADRHDVEIQDFEGWGTVRRSMSHRPGDVGKVLERSESAVCHWKRDYTQHIGPDLVSESAAQAIHQAPVPVRYLYPLPLVVLMVSRG